jgi:hypothetical protein
MVLALVIPIAVSQWMPIFARVIAGAPVHVCHCDTQGPHAECSCPICSPGRDDLISDDIAVRGSCGDDATPPGKALLMPAILPASSKLIPYSERAPRVAGLAPPPDGPTFEPPTPPPRSPRLIPALGVAPSLRRGAFFGVSLTRGPCSRVG